MHDVVVYQKEKSEHGEQAAITLKAPMRPVDNVRVSVRCHAPVSDA